MKLYLKRGIEETKLGFNKKFSDRQPESYIPSEHDERDVGEQRFAVAQLEDRRGFPPDDDRGAEPTYHESLQERFAQGILIFLQNYSSLPFIREVFIVSC